MGFLLVYRLRERARRRRAARRYRDLLSTVRGWLDGDGDRAEAARALGDAPFPVLRRLLGREGDGGGDGPAGEEEGEGPGRTRGLFSPEERERVVGLARASGWLRRLRRLARSRVFWWRRLRAVALLRLLGRREDARVLETLIGDPRPEVEAAAFTTIRVLTPVGLLPGLLARAPDVDPGRERMVREALVAYGDRLVGPLVAALRRGETERELSFLLSVAADLGAPALRQVVLERRDDPRLEVRISAVRALRSFPPDGESRRALQEAARDEAWQVRTQAARGLGKAGGPGAVDVLGDLLGDPSWWVRLRAGLALRELGEDGRSVLARAREGSDEFARDMATYVIRLARARGGVGGPPSPGRPPGDPG